MRKRKTDHGQRGFTLVELMVAVFVGAIIIYGMYSIYASSQRIFHEEHRISQSQLGARLGMEIIKNDFKRSGFMMSPNIDVDPMVCRNVGGPGLINIHPIVHTNGTAGVVYDQSGNPVNIFRPDLNAAIAADSVMLAGNYVTTQSYLAQTIKASAGSITLQNIRRQILPGEDPTIPPADPTDQEFARMFPTNSYLRVVNKYGYMMFTRINAVSSAAQRNITVNPSLPDASTASVKCGVHGYGEGSEINVVNLVLYRLERDPNDATGKKTDLVRWEVDADLNTIQNTREIIVEYAVDFQVWFRMDNPSGATDAWRPNIDYVSDVPADSVVVDVPAGNSEPPLDGTVNAHPENMRVAIIKLSIRTAEEDVTFPFIPRGAGDPLVRFELAPNGIGAAHVRTIIAQVELPNIAFRNLRN